MEYQEFIKSELLVLVVFMLLIPAGIFLGFHINERSAEKQGKISAGYSSDLVGEDYEVVEAHLRAAGFTNIELIDLDDAGILFWRDGKVAMISIGGVTDFDSTD